MLIARRYSPEMAAARELRDELSPLLERCGITAERVNDLLLAVSEAFTNIVRHGSPRPTFISVTLVREDAILRLTLEDDGGFFDAFETRLAAAADPASTPLAEGGMGLGLIAQLVSATDYRRCGSVNRLSFSEPVAARRLPAVVLVDDDAVTRTLARGYLQDDYAIREYDDAETALAAIAADPPDLIISDIGMPKMDGIEMRTRLQRDETTALIPFIFLTGLDSDQVEEQASALEIDDFLTKPITRRRLVNSADRILRRSRQLKEALQSSVDRRITASLRPRLPRSAGPWSLDVLEQAVSPGGGDIVLYRSDEDWISLILLDVMGHGVPAKIFAFAYAGFVQSLLADDRLARHPDALIGELSRRIGDDGRFDETIVTCVAACLTHDGQATLAVGGHPRPLLRRGESSWRPVPVDGAMPGLGGPPPTPRTVAMEPGDALLLVSDGLGEALSRSHPETALVEMLNAGGTPDDRLLTRLDTATADAGDDRTAVLLRFGEPATR